MGRLGVGKCTCPAETALKQLKNQFVQLKKQAKLYINDSNGKQICCLDVLSLFLSCQNFHQNH